MYDVTGRRECDGAVQDAIEPLGVGGSALGDLRSPFQ
jgi:hypothetical protein